MAMANQNPKERKKDGNNWEAVERMPEETCHWLDLHAIMAIGFIHVLLNKKKIPDSPLAL